MWHYTLYFAALAVIVYGAPQYYHNYHHQHGAPEFHRNFPAPYHHHHNYEPSDAFGEDYFDTRRFWMDLNREMMSLEAMMQDFNRKFPTSVSTSGYENSKYKITIPMMGFEEKEIAVKAKDSVLMVQAVHNGEIQKTYMDIRILPADVDNHGTWTYDGKILIIEFGTKEVKPESTDTTPSQEDEVTEGIEKKGSREEMDTNEHTEDTQNADVGLDNKKVQNSNEEEDIEKNVIPDQSRIEATTYAVDFKDEVEFVPVKY